MKKISFLRRNTEAAAGMPLPEPVQLEDRVQAARDQVAQQHDPALVEALSARELAANRALAERIRDAERREQLARIEAAEAAAERVRRTAAALADREADDLIRAGRAIAEQRHTSSPHAKVARLHRRKTLVLGILSGVVGFAMLFSAVTVQHNIAPTGGVGNLMWWLSYGLETLISGMLVALMLSTSDTAEWDAIEEPWKVNAIEAVLLALTVTLNVFPYWKAGDWYNVGVHSIAPITIGAALATHSVVAGRYGQAIERATAAVPEHEDLQARLAALTNIGGSVDLSVHQAASGITDRASIAHTVQPQASYLAATPGAMRRAGETAQIVSETAQIVDRGADKTVQREAAAEVGTAQTSSTVQVTEQSETVHRAREAETVELTVHAEQHTVHAETEQPAAVSESTEFVSAATVHNSTVQVPDTEHLADGNEVERLSIPKTDQAETVQIPSTVQVTEQPETVHRAGKAETVHRAPSRAVQVTEQSETVHRAGRSVTEQQTPDDAELWALAAEVHGGVRTKFSVEDVARVLIANRRDGFGPDRIYRDKIGPHRDISKKWIDRAIEIEQERTAGMAPVISLHKG